MATITGTDGNDVLQGTATADTITGLAGNDVLIGDAGNDILDGGTGADTMIGGAGADTFYVDNTGDVVTEGTDADTDVVNTTVSYTLGANVENLIAATSTGGAVSASLTLNGNNLANQITGGTGNDVIYGGNDGATTDVNGNPVAAAAADALTGGSGNDTYIIREGADDVIVETANDTLNGTTGGNDTVIVVASQTRTTYALSAAAAVENIIASDGASTLGLNLIGNTFAQTIVGNAGVNILSDGGSVAAGAAGAATSGGADTLIGLGGDDIYNVTTGLASVVETNGNGNDAINIISNGAAINVDGSGNVTGLRDFNYTGVSVETITANATGTGNLNITGSTIDQTISGNAGANVLNGGGGVDTLIGLGGNDTYVVDSLDDVVVEAANGGTDRVSAQGNYYIGQTAEIEILTLGTQSLTTAVGGDGTLDLNAVLTGTTNGYLVGNDFSQTLYGDASGNILNGFRGVNGDGTGTNADTLVGGGGNDTYRVYNQTDVVVEDTNGGTQDFIYTSASYDLSVNDTNARAATLNGTGRAGSAYLGTTAPSQIEVLSAADQSSGASGTRGTASTILDLTGNAYGQIIIGNYSDNVISDGGSLFNGVQYQDQLAGLRGNDTYNVTAQNTTVNENAGEGTDVVNVNLDNSGGQNFFGLIAAAEVEYVNATGVNAISLLGNQYNQVITGNAAANTLNGGGGQDTLVGGGGSDSYVVDSTNAANVSIIEAANVANDVDRVVTSVSFDLAATNASYTNSADTVVAAGGIIGIEQIVTQNGQGTEAINLTGNGAAQILVGNYGNNILNGDNDSRVGDVATGELRGTGIVTVNTIASGTNTADVVTAAGDTLTGLLGNDTYRVYNQADVIRENGGEGTDTVFTSGNYQLRTGNSIEVLSAADQSSTTGLRLVGNEFAQTIIGTAGNDQIWGGNGTDTLIGGAGSDTFGFAQTGAANADILQDFAPGDFIGLHSTGNAATSAFGGLGTTFDQNEFVVGTTATENHAQVIYNQTTGQLFYDADGTGTASAAVLFATLAPNTVLGFNDFEVIASAPTTAAAA